MIKEAFVSFELAKLLTERGFNLLPIGEDCIPCMYDENGNIHWGMYDPNWYWRITHQTTLKWLREEHDIFIQPCIVNGVTVTMDQRYYFYNIFRNRNKIALSETYYNTPEEAVEAALKYCLENLI